MKYISMMMTYSMILTIASIYMLFNNMFISLEITLMNSMTFNVPISLLIDWMSCMFMSTVMFISSMIIMFSMYYIPSKEHKNFSMLLLMFILSMKILILSDNIIFILLGWDGLGLSSYMLVIYYQNYSSAGSGSITLISNRMGDIMILISISISMMYNNWNFNMNSQFNMMTLMLILIAASSKSAQFPFSAWLPAAMAAPTPISALVHSSTLVTAGVFISIRIMNNPHPIIMLMLMLSSSATAMYAGMAANWEQDMKKIIALSTLSQIAMMMFAISMKSSTMAFFHLITHALFKSTMFLCAGIMINSSSYQDMRMMGMNYSKYPLTSSIMGISSMALMGIPFMSGFFSKDSIIELMINSKHNMIISFMMISSIGLTSTYNIRMLLLSNNSSFKSKPDMNEMNNMYSNMSIHMMIPFSIMIGSMMMWILTPEQMFMLPNKFKMLILSSLMLGMITGMILSFKSKKFVKMGIPAISLWFNHSMTTSMMMMSSTSMTKMLKNDLTWQEMFGPMGLYLFLKKYSKMPDMLKISTMFMLMMMLLLPMIMY